MVDALKKDDGLMKSKLDTALPDKTDIKSVAMPITKKVIADRAGDPTRLTAVGELADARFRDLRNIPSLQALKLHAFMFKSAGGAVTEDRWHTIKMVELKHTTGLKNHDRETLTDLLAQLRGVVMEWNAVRKNGRKFTTIAGLLDIAEVDFEDEGEGPATMRWKFGEGFRRVVEESDYWAVIDRQTMFALSSRYSFRLFELLSVRANMKYKKSEVFSVEDLRARLGVPEGKMVRWQDFRRYALESAIKEVNQLARFTVAMKPKKDGRRITGVELTWKMKSDLGTTKRELDVSKTGRKARRDGTTENLVPIFPNSGGIRYSPPWAEIAQTHGNGKDINMIAGDFRKWCAKKTIKLDSPTLTKTFETFCKGAKI